MTGQNSGAPQVVPGQTPDDDEWMLREQSLLEQLEKDYVERLREQQPETSVALRELRKRYDAGEMTAEQYERRRLEIRRKQLGWL